MRKHLLVLSLFLIISVKIAGNQLEMMTSADYGFDPEGIINVKISNTSYDSSTHMHCIRLCYCYYLC